MSALSCWYYLFYCFYFLAFHLLYLRVHEHRWPRDWRLAAAALCLGGVALLLSPLIVPMLLNGLHAAPISPAAIFSSPIFLAIPPSADAFAEQRERRVLDAFTGNAWEGTVYLGLANLVLLGWGLWRTRDGERRLLWYALGGMIFSRS